MSSINFETGLKKYIINNDDNCFIMVNLSDPNIYERAKSIIPALEAYEKTVTDNDDPITVMAKMDEIFKDRFDFAFGTGTSEKVFGGMNVTTVVNDNGDCLFETFMAAFMPVLQADIKEAEEKRNKHFNELDAVAKQIKRAAK